MADEKKAERTDADRVEGLVAYLARNVANLDPDEFRAQLDKASDGKVDQPDNPDSPRAILTEEQEKAEDEATEKRVEAGKEAADKAEDERAAAESEANKSE